MNSHPLEVIQTEANSRRRGTSIRRLSAYAGLSLVLAVFAAAAGFLLFGNAALNGFGKAKMEGAFAKAYPGCALRFGRLTYSASANCLAAESVTLAATNATMKTGRISLTGVRWTRFLWGKSRLADALATANLEATNLDLKFSDAHYALRCGRLKASAPRSELKIESTELRTLIADEEFFAADDYRTTRFHVVVPECMVSGVAYGELLLGNACRARSVRLSQPFFDALVNRDKPVKPFLNRPLMVTEALAAIPVPLLVENLEITNGHVTYAERVVAGAAPGVLTFATVNVSVAGIANRQADSATIQLRAQGDFMNAALLKVQMNIPVAGPDCSLHYSGSLSAMDLTRLDAFLDIAERTRIKSGSAQEASFDITVTNGVAHGSLRAIYHDLEIAFLDTQTGTEKGLKNRAFSLLANLKIRNSRVPDSSGSMKEGRVNYTRKPEDEFLQVAWFGLRSGVLDVISR